MEVFYALNRLWRGTFLNTFFSLEPEKNGSRKPTDDVIGLFRMRFRLRLRKRMKMRKLDRRCPHRIRLQGWCPNRRHLQQRPNLLILWVNNIWDISPLYHTLTKRSICLWLPQWLQYTTILERITKVRCWHMVIVRKSLLEISKRTQKEMRILVVVRPMEVGVVA